MEATTQLKMWSRHATIQVRSYEFLTLETPVVTCLLIIGRGYPYATRYQLGTRLTHLHKNLQVHKLWLRKGKHALRWISGW